VFSLSVRACGTDFLKEILDTLLLKVQKQFELFLPLFYFIFLYFYLADLSEYVAPSCPVPVKVCAIPAS
jgi:hypothetical protein